MLILGIETTGAISSVALYDGSVVTEIKNEDNYSHLQQLMPMVKKLMDEEGVKGEMLDAVAISKGPGSFTGIRIGMASAKGLAQIWDKPMIEVPTLAGFAFRDYDWIEDDKKILFVPLFDAKMHQIYAAAYEKNNMRSIVSDGVYDPDEFLSKLAGVSENYDAAVYFGDGIRAYEEKLKDVDLACEYAFAPDEDICQSALGVVRVAEILMQDEKNLKSCYDAQPEYFRMAEAERQLKEKQVRMASEK